MSEENISVIADGWVLTYAAPTYDKLIFAKRCSEFGRGEPVVFDEICVDPAPKAK